MTVHPPIRRLAWAAVVTSLVFACSSIRPAPASPDRRGTIAGAPPDMSLSSGLEPALLWEIDSNQNHVEALATVIEPDHADVLATRHRMGV